MFSSCKACTEMMVTRLQVLAASSHLRARCSQRTLFRLRSSPRRFPARAHSTQTYRHYLLTMQAAAVLHARPLMLGTRQESNLVRGRVSMDSATAVSS